MYHMHSCIDAHTYAHTHAWMHTGAVTTSLTWPGLDSRAAVPKMRADKAWGLRRST